MRTVTAYDLGAFAAQATTRQNTAHGLGAHVVNVKTAADYERVRSGSGRFPGVMPDEPAPAGVPVQQARAPVQRAGSSELARKEINPFVIRGRVNADQIAARDRAVAGLARPSLDKEYAASGFSGFRLKPVGEYGQASGGATFPLEYQIVATGPDGQEQLINTIKSRNAQTEPDLNPSNINKMVQQGAQRLGMKAGPKPPAPRPPIAADKFLADLAARRAAEPAANKTPAPAAPAPVAQAPARPAPAPVAPVAAPVAPPAPAPATPPPAPAQPDQIGPMAPITMDNALGGPNGGQPSPPEPEPASAPTPATLDPFKITQLGSSLVTPETRTKVNPGWPTPRTTALSDYHEANPKLRRNGPAMYADPSEQYHADMLNNNLMPRVDTWEQQPDGSFRSDNTEQSHAYAQPTLRMADEVRREQAAVGNNPADYPTQAPAPEPDAGPNGPNAGNYVPPAAPEAEPVSALQPPEMLPKLNDQTVLAQRMNFENSRRQEEYDQTLKQRQDVGNNPADYPTQAPAAANAGDSILPPPAPAANPNPQQNQQSINDLGFADPNYVPPTATPTPSTQPTYGQKGLTRQELATQRSVGNVGKFAPSATRQAKPVQAPAPAAVAPKAPVKPVAAPAPAAAAPKAPVKPVAAPAPAAAPKAPAVPVTPPAPPVPTPPPPKPTPPPVAPPPPVAAPTPPPPVAQRYAAPAPAYQPPAARPVLGGGLFGRRRR